MDLAAFVVLHAVTVLLDRSSHPDLEIFRIFEEAIGMLVSDYHTAHCWVYLNTDMPWRHS